MINKMVYRIIGLVLLLFTQFLYATEVFQWTDAQGRRHYSDKKRENASIYKLTESFSYYKVKKVYDGDTLLLMDGRKIRLLGINTPEIEHSNQTAQAGGDAARKWLTQQLLGTRIRLEFDQQKRDKYKRHLAHIFTEQDVHINRELVRLGFASTSIFPPNLKYVPEFLVAEQAAEAKHLGIWG
ncbi:MAG: thermonuclease family protein, partial [Methyloprofundus sp.]|nr:thermonuclease family protein [Methyloprofundus sp.]